MTTDPRQDAAEARTLAEKATPGPWEYRDDIDGIYVCSIAPDAPRYGDDDRPVDLLADGREEDWRFFARCRTLVPALADHIDSLLAERDTALEWIRKNATRADVYDALLAERDALRAQLTMKLPCDVRLPPHTKITKGCSLDTLLVALKMRARQEGKANE